MAKVLLVLATIDTPMPATQTFGGSYLYTIGGGVAKISADTTIEFDEVADGSYTATCQSLDTSNAPINDMVSVDFIVSTPATGTPPAPPAPGPGATYPAPAALTATVSY